MKSDSLESDQALGLFTSLLQWAAKWKTSTMAGSVSLLCVMSYEGTCTNKDFQEFWCVHIYSIISSSQWVHMTHWELDWRVKILWSQVPPSSRNKGSSHCLWRRWVMKHYLRLSPASVTSWDNPSCRLATKDLRWDSSRAFHISSSE